MDQIKLLPGKRTLLLNEDSSSARSLGPSQIGCFAIVLDTTVHEVGGIFKLMLPSFGFCSCDFLPFR